MQFVHDLFFEPRVSPRLGATPHSFMLISADDENPDNREPVVPYCPSHGGACDQIRKILRSSSLSDIHGAGVAGSLSAGCGNWRSGVRISHEGGFAQH